MDNGRREIRIVSLLLAWTVMLILMAGLGWTLTASAYNLQEANELTGYVTAPDGGEVLDVSNKDNVRGSCTTPLAIADSTELDLCIQEANAEPGAASLGITSDILLTSTLTVIDSEILLQGNGYFVDGNDSYRVFEISAGGLLDVHELAIQNGSAGEGGGIYNGGRLNLTDSWVMTNTANLGGGIMNAISSTVVATNTHFISNTGTFGGGAIYNAGLGAVLNASGASFLRNSAPSNGGGGLNNIDDAVALLKNTLFISNSAGSDGGAIYNTDVGLVTFIGGVLEDNYAEGSNGGAIFNSDVDSTVIVSGTLIQSNTAGVDGGGFFNTQGAHLDLIGVHIRGNAANSGGGIAIESDATVEVIGAVFLDNRAIKGGAISVNGDGSSATLVTLTNTHILSNIVTLDGGGIYNTSDGVVMISASTIRGNSAAFGAGYSSSSAAATLIDTSVFDNNSTGAGGGLASEASGSLSIIDSTIGDNTAATVGGGILITDSSSLILMNSTVSGNSSAIDGGAILNEGSAILTNTTIANNTAAGGFGIASLGDMSLASSIVAYSGGNGNCSGITSDDDGRFNLSSDASCNFLDPTSIPDDDPLLGPLQNNGGETWTHAPQYESPALNHIPVGLNGCGTSISVDQRNVSRPQDGLCDIGAFESISYPLSVFKDGDGSGSIGGNGIDCGSACSENYPETTYLTLTASADTGSIFDGWNGACTGTSECQIAMTAGHVVTATFLKNQRLLSVNLDGDGSGDVTSEPSGIGCPGDCDELFDYGTVVTLTANAATGSTFAGWSGGGCVGTGACIATMTAVRIITATFTLDQQLLTLDLEGTGSGGVTSAPGGISCPGDCMELYGYGAVITLTASADPGSGFIGWDGACSGDGDCIVAMTANKIVTATFDLGLETLDVSIVGNGIGSVTSDPLGIDCPGDCTDSYLNGTVVTLTANGDVSSSFSGWSGACTGEGDCVITMTASRHVTAAFTLNTHMLSVSTEGNGSGSVDSDPFGIACPGDCDELFDYGIVVTLTASAGTGSTFGGWSGVCSGQGECVVSITADRQVTATFDLDQQLLSVSTDGNGSGTVNSVPAGIDCPGDCGDLYDYGTVVTLTASASTGSTFSGWEGDCTGQDECFVSMTASRLVTATFTLDQHPLTVAMNGSGSGSVNSDPVGIACPGDCDGLYDYGTVVTLTASASTGSTFTGWSGACVGGGDCVVSMTSSRLVTATFTLDQQLLSISTEGTGSGIVTSDPLGIACPGDCDELYDYGTVVTLTASTGTGSTFTGWSGACSGTGICVVTMDAAKSVTAIFAKDDFMIYLAYVVGPPS